MGQRRNYTLEKEEAEARPTISEVLAKGTEKQQKHLERKGTVSAWNMEATEEEKERVMESLDLAGAKDMKLNQRTAWKKKWKKLEKLDLHNDKGNLGPLITLWWNNN